MRRMLPIAEYSVGEGRMRWLLQRTFDLESAIGTTTVRRVSIIEGLANRGDYSLEIIGGTYAKEKGRGRGLGRMEGARGRSPSR